MKLKYLVEYVDYKSVKDLALNISDIIKYEKMIVIRNVESPKIFEVSNNSLIPYNGEIFRLENLIINYKNYFNKNDIVKSEIIKIDYDDRNWIVIFLCYEKNINYSVISYSPDLNNSPVIKILNNYLDSKNFQLIKKPLMTKNFSIDFLSGIVKIFRNISGRYYSYKMLPVIKNEYEKFKSEHIDQWKIFNLWKKKNLGSSVKCMRIMGLSNNFKFHMVDGGTKSFGNLKINDNFYYPISGRDFSQWAEIGNKKIKDIKTDLGSTGIGGSCCIVSYIPTDKIVFCNNILPYNFSPNVVEYEVVVEHDITKEFDSSIICKIC